MPFRYLLTWTYAGNWQIFMTVMILFQMIVYVNWKLTLLAMVPMLLTKFKGKMLIEHILECTKDLFVKRVVVTRTKEILRLAYDDRQGTPILFDKKYFLELSELPEKKRWFFCGKKISR